jgi:L-amino acid N-acyltransferase YncA
VSRVTLDWSLGRLSIRRAGPDDAAQVAHVLNEAIVGEAATLLDTLFRDVDERAYIEALPVGAFIDVAELEGDRIIRFQSVEPWASFVTSAFDHVATMGTFVAEGRRRRGVGARLAEVSFAAARELGYEKILTDIRADNLGSLAFHLSLGFTVVGTARRQARVGERELDVVFVERFL